MNQIIQYLGNLEHALEQLQIYKKVLMDEGLPENLMELPELKNGWLAAFDSEEEKHAKKMLVAASVENIMSDPTIPEGEKEEMAREKASAIRQIFDTIKIDMTPMSRPELTKRKVAGILSAAAKGIEQVKEKIKKDGIKKTAAEAVGKIATAVGVVIKKPISGKVVERVAETIFSFVPQSWVEKAEKKTIKFLDEAVKTVENISDTVKNTPILTIIRKPIEKIMKSKFVSVIKQSVEKTFIEVGSRLLQVLHA